MFTRTRWLLALVAALALLLAACNDDTDPEDLDEDGPAEVDEDTEDDDEVDEPDDLGLADEGVLQVGSDLDFEPFEFIDEDGEPAGFDMDLIDDIGERLGVEVEIVNVAFDTLITQLEAGEYDAVISAMTITEDRAERVDFTEPYFAANQALVTQEDGDIAGVDDLAGADVGVQAGTTGLDYATENFTESEIVEFPGTPEAFTALESDQVDAVFIDLPVASEHAERSDALALVDEVDTDEEYGIAVQQGNDALLSALNDAIADILDDGTYEDIYSQWFEGDVPEQFQ